MEAPEPIPSPEVAEPPAALTPATREASTRPPAAERVKAWGDAATALLKAFLLVLAIAIVGVIAGTAVWRDQRTRSIAVEVDPEAGKTLRALGSDLDLRQALIDALNQRVRGVQQIVALQGLAPVVNTAQANAVSFKPFGLDLSTNDVTHMAREVFGSPPPTSVRIELVCAPLACTQAGATKGLLLVTLLASQGGRRVSFPVPLVAAGLRRSLRQAMQRSADLVLEQVEPLIASIFYLNVTGQDLFADEKRHHFVQAEGVALTLRRAGAKDRCLADLVLGGTLFFRGRLRDGIAAERRAASAANLECKVHAETNIAFLLAAYALCSPAPNERKFAYDQAQQALDRLPQLSRGMTADLVYYRVPASRLTLEAVQAVQAAGDDTIRAAICAGARTPPPGIRAGLLPRIGTILDHLRTELPPNALLPYDHGVLDALRRLLEVGVPSTDVVGRYVMANRMIQVIDAYALVDRTPRQLFVLQGKLAMDMARAAHDALALPQAAKVKALAAAGVNPALARSDPDAILLRAIADSLAASAVAFENATVTDAAPLIEPSSDMPPLILLGDARYAAGDSAGAEDAYARAVDIFTEDDEPVDEVRDMATAVAGWESVRIAGGACLPDATPDRAWEDRWARLGAGSHDVCALREPIRSADWPTLYEIIRPLIANAITLCAQASPLSAHLPDDWRAALDTRFAMLDCLRRRGPGDLHVIAPFVTGQASTIVNAQIEHALNALP